MLTIGRSGGAARVREVMMCAARSRISAGEQEMESKNGRKNKIDGEARGRSD